MPSIFPYIIVFLSTLALFAVLDLLWIGVVMRDFYRQGVGHLMSDRTHWKAGIVFYVLYVIGLMFFAISPSIIAHTFLGAAILGGLFGFFTYATYDLTNLATLRDWPLRVVIVDMVWGTISSLTVSLMAFSIASLLL